MAAQRGDREAIGQLFEQFERVVYAIAFRRLGDHAECRKFARRYSSRLCGRSANSAIHAALPAGWRSMATRMSLNRAVRGPRMPVMPESFEVECPGQQTPLGDILDQECRAQVHSGLDRLSTLDRETLVAFYFDGRTLIEMSDQFRSPVGTIKRRLHVARKRLARELATTMV